MISIITEEVLDAAREMNRRDVRRAEQSLEGEHQDNINPSPREDEDDEIWAKYEGIEGLKGAEGQPVKGGTSYYSYGPYARNRRLLADIALACGWKVEKARILERRFIKRSAKHMSACKNPSIDLSNPSQPKVKRGIPFTFQHVSMETIRLYMQTEMKDIDPAKMAVIKAAVLDLYGTNSKGRKKIPVYPPGTKRVDDETFPVSKEDVERAQEELDKEARYRKATRMHFLDRQNYIPPDKVKLRIKAFLKSSGMSKEDFCKAIHVTEDAFEAFMSERKKRPQLESKVYHEAPPYISEQKGEGKPARKRKRDIADLDINWL
ncbi:hypothetical protein F5Y06DRAFT_239915 [Hypoxylon sp. FL0890]|nr:hypothetical protein F5Y06DRAFT_239915 [Hypoxylon sp. FL0890]